MAGGGLCHYNLLWEIPEAEKSYCLYDTVVREAIENPDKNYLVIVPEQFTMQTQKDLCLAHPKGGIMNIDVLSFRASGVPRF